MGQYLAHEAFTSNDLFCQKWMNTVLITHLMGLSGSVILKFCNPRYEGMVAVTL